jgi:murein DD-endopeptidase MepM/ murein hydrolase activator NlpD
MKNFWHGVGWRMFGGAVGHWVTGHGRRWRSLGWGFGAIALVLLMANLAAAVPSRLTVSPNAPQLGDTLVVAFESAATAPAPTVSMGGKTYPVFALAEPSAAAQAPSGLRFRALLPTTPLDKPGSLAIQANHDGQSVRSSVTLRNRSFPTQSIWLPPGKDGNIDDREYDIVDAFKQRVSPTKYWSGRFLRPNDGPVTTGYGVRRYYNGVFANDYFHRGVDYAGNYGSPVRAAAAGQVALIGRESQGFRVHGNTVGLDHGQGVETIYIHLSRIDVKEGDFVKAGQVIGALGGTGAATGPHLHWGLYVNGQCVDPVPWRERGFD